MSFKQNRICIDLCVNYREYKNSDIVSLVKVKVHEICKLQTHIFPIYLGISEINIDDKLYLQQYSLNVLHILVNCKVHYYDLTPGELILVKVKDIDEKGNLICAFFDKLVVINKSQYASKEPRFKVVNNVKSITFSDAKVIKTGDILKTKIIDISKDRFYDIKINGSIKGITYGKLAWFK